MTVNELKEFLSTCPSQAEIFIQTKRLSDHGRTSVLATAYELSHPSEKRPPTVLLVPKILT